MFKTYLDKITDNQDKGFAVFLGRAKTGVDLPNDRYAVFSNSENKKLKSVYDLDPKLFKDGLSVVINTDEYVTCKDEFGEAQKYLAYLYCKFIHFPKNSLKIPDPFGVRSENWIDILHETNKLKNLPLLLRYPVLDKLALTRVNKPVLVLLPGPSLPDIGPVLPELASKCLIVCLSRTISFCLEKGVEPDFIVQLDTHQRQRHFYPPGHQFKKSYLVTLSMSPVHYFARQFRGVFFMESFNVRVLPNTFRIRESWLSSLLPCLGLAEALYAPQVFLAGADLSFSSSNKQYFNQANNDQHRALLESSGNCSSNTPLIIQEESFPIPDINGRPVMTNLHYFATAAEAKFFAQEIRKTTNSIFFNLTRKGILSPKYFIPADTEQILKLNDINRDTVHQKADHAMNKTEKIDYYALKAETSKTIEELKNNVLFLQNCSAGRNYHEACKHPFFQAVSHSKELLGDFSVEEKLNLTINLVNEWIAQARQARKLAELHHLRKKGRRLLVVCLPEEKEKLSSELNSRYPQWKIIRCIWDETFPPDQNGDFNWIMLNDLLKWLKQKKLAVISDRVSRKYDYLFNLFPLDNVISLDETMLLELPPRKEEQIESCANPINEDPNLRLGFYYLKKGNAVKAEHYLQLALEKNPGNQDARTALNILLNTFQ